MPGRRLPLAADTNIPTGPASRAGRGLTLAVLCVAVLVAQVDTSVVNLAVGPIGRAFQAGVGTLQWVVDAYNLVYAVFLLSGGLLADLYGRRRVFMVGAGVFTAASLLCAGAPDVPVLIAGRALAGLGAALLLPASLSIIRVVWQDEAERGRALGVWAGCNGLAFVIGPTLGGLLIDRFGWRSIFLVVVPLGLAALAAAPRAIPESADPAGRAFDAPAQLLGAMALGGLAVAAIAAKGAPLVAGAGLACLAVALPLFLRIEAARGDAALLPLDLFRRRAFRGAVAATAGMTFGMYGVLFLLPLFWQSAGRLGPVGAGLGLLPMAAVFVAVSPFSGALTSRFGSRATTAGGVAVIGGGMMLVALTAAAQSLWPAIAGLAVTGLGMGLATGPLMGVAVGAVGAARSGTAAALINVARMAGATIGVAVLGAVFALAQGSPQGNTGGGPGLRLALLLGGLVQLAAAGAAWIEMRPEDAPRR